ncbi:MULTISPECIES: hypothetical protein [Amycolatopsis]|nr:MULTISPECIES: hypothetical protein [Amycolatopsis]MCG3753621.1 hypothetical protein [Amycolatopsis sp. Poz14]
MTQRVAEPRPHRTTIVVTALLEHGHITTQGTHPEPVHTEPAYRTAALS